MARIELRPVPTHPDRAASLDFQANMVYASHPVAVAHGAVLTNMLANRKNC